MTRSPPNPAQIGSDLRHVIGEIARQSRRVTTLPTRLAEPLGYLDRQGPMTTSELATIQGIRQQSMAATLEELDELGYLRRGPHPTDRRKILITITAAGRDRMLDDRQRRATWLADEIATKLTGKQQQTLAESVMLLRQLINR